MPSRANLIGERFASLVVSADAGSRNLKSLWKCVCDCGSVVFVAAGDLRNGHTKSCGCTKSARVSAANHIHGLSRTPEYGAWKNMIARCTDPDNDSWRDYGGRGITVCEEWRGDPIAFYKYVGPRPSGAHSIDRIDNDGNYEPGNVKWSTPEQQATNRREAHVGRDMLGRFREIA